LIPVPGVKSELVAVVKNVLRHNSHDTNGSCISEDENLVHTPWSTPLRQYNPNIPTTTKDK